MDDETSRALVGADGVGSVRIDWPSVNDHGIRTAIDGSLPAVAPAPTTS